MDLKTGMICQIEPGPGGYGPALTEFRQRFDAEILERIVALNASRSAEEAQGKIRWLRPEYQIPLLAPAAQQSALKLIGVSNKKTDASKTKKPTAKKAAWPATLAERAKAIESALVQADSPQTAAQLAQRFARAKPSDIQEILETLTALGKAHESDTKSAYVR